MESSPPGNAPILLFCKACGELRVKDVKEQLQKLFTTKSVPVDVCFLCFTALHPQEIQVSMTDIKDVCGVKTINPSKIKTEPNSDEEPDDYVNVQLPVQLRDAVDTSATLVKTSDLRSSESSVRIKTDIIQGDKTRPVKTRYGRKTSVLSLSDPVLSGDDDDDDGGDTDNTHVKKKRRQLIKTEASDDEDPAFEARQFDESSADDDEADEDISDADLADETMLKSSHPRHGLHPKLLDMMRPSSVNPKRPFSCKFCTEEFGKLLVFQKHVQTHTGEEPLKKPYHCTICKTDYQRLYRYQSHKEMHRNMKRFVCKHAGCKRAFKTSSVYKKHLLTHSKHKPFKCKYCQKRFRRRYGRLVHELYHKGDRRFKCKTCNKAFVLKHVMLEHETIHTGEKPFQCQVCPYRCRLKRMLDAHHQKVHLRKSYRCERCQQVFNSKLWYTKHCQLNKCKPPKPPRVKVNADDAQAVDIDISNLTEYLDPEIVAFMDKPIDGHKLYKCKQCTGKVHHFYILGPFLKHISTHMPQGYTSTKPYVCPHCGQRCKRSAQMALHKTVHTVVRPFACSHPGCEKTFKSKDHLNVHCCNVHVKDKMFICEICAKGFNTSTKLAKHVLRHGDERNIQCDHCDKRFKLKSELKRHENRMHNPNGRTMCELCGKSFKNKDNLKTHSIIHTGLKPFACTVCSYRCNRSDNLKKHMRMHLTEGTPQQRRPRKERSEIAAHVQYGTGQVNHDASGLLSAIAPGTASATAHIAAPMGFNAPVSHEGQLRVPVQGDLATLAHQSETVNAVAYVLL